MGCLIACLKIEPGFAGFSVFMFAESASYFCVWPVNTLGNVFCSPIPCAVKSRHRCGCAWGFLQVQLKSCSPPWRDLSTGRTPPSCSSSNWRHEKLSLQLRKHWKHKSLDWMLISYTSDSLYQQNHVVNLFVELDLWRLIRQTNYVNLWQNPCIFLSVQIPKCYFLSHRAVFNGRAYVYPTQPCKECQDS